MATERNPVFSELHGYFVKDAYAREKIAEDEITVEEIRQTTENLTKPAATNTMKMMDEIGTREGLGSNAIFACALSWLKNNDKIYYGNEGNCNSFTVENGVLTPMTDPISRTVVDGKYPMDCMSFVDMCLRGIGFEESAYGDKSNTMKYPCMSIDWNKWDFAKYAMVSNNTVENAPVVDFSISEYDEGEYHRVLTHQYARLLRDRGLYAHIGGTTVEKARNMLRTGDILFYGNPSNSEYSNRFDGIYHCAIFVGWNKDDSPIILDCGDRQTDPVNIHSPADAHSVSRLMGYARIPLGGAGAMGLESDLDLRVPKGNLAQKTNDTEFVWLATKTKKWNVYKFTVAYMFTNVADIANSFPAIYWIPTTTIINRMTPISSQAKEANKWYIADIIVVIDEDHAHIDTATITDENDRFHARFYPTPSNNAYIRCLKVTPIMLDTSDGISLGRYELADDYSETVFSSYTDVVNYIKAHYIDHVNNGDVMNFTFKSVTVNNTIETAFIKAIKLRSDTYKIAAWNNIGIGAVLDKKHSVTEPVITTYATNEFPFEQWM